MRNFELNSNDAFIDVRDVIERYEELEDDKELLEADIVDASSPDDQEQAEDALEEWRNDNESEFTALKNLLEDCGELPKDLPSYLSITVDYDALQMDYSTVEIDGIDYYYR